MLNIDVPNLQTMTLTIFHQRRRMIKAHWLVIQQCAEECGQIAVLEVSTGIGQECEARCVALRETVQGKGADGLGDHLLRCWSTPFLVMPAVSFVSNCCILS